MLGQAVVEQRSFVGSFERLRLRLPPLPGVRAIAPPVPFGSDEVWIEATRSQDQARRFPLRPGDTTWVGVQRVHALVHPGLRFLLLTDGSPRVARGARRWAASWPAAPTPGSPCSVPAAADDAGERALQEAREQLGSGLAALETRLIAGAAGRGGAPRRWRAGPATWWSSPCRRSDGSSSPRRVLAAGQHHLLLVAVPRRRREQVPARLLICVAVGEPGKEDVSSPAASRATWAPRRRILTVLPATARGPPGRRPGRALPRRQRPHARPLGVPVATRVRYGAVREEILAQIAEGEHDLLVLGAPLPGRDGRIALGGFVGRLLPEVAHLPVLIVRSPEAVS